MIKTQLLPGDLIDRGVVHVERRREVWLRRVNGQTGHVLVVPRPALLNLRKNHKYISCVNQSRDCVLFVSAQHCRNKDDEAV